MLYTYGVGINQGRSLEAYPSESDTAVRDWPTVLPASIVPLFSIQIWTLQDVLRFDSPPEMLYCMQLWAAALRRNVT